VCQFLALNVKSNDRQSKVMFYADGRIICHCGQGRQRNILHAKRLNVDSVSKL